jgi:hypothetical protein
MNRTDRIFTAFLVAVAACGGESESSGSSGIPDEPTLETESRPDQSCRALSPEDCPREAACYVTEAWRFDERGQCWGERQEPAGCAARDVTQNDALEAVRAPDGQCWLFGSATPPLSFMIDQTCPELAPTCGR